MQLTMNLSEGQRLKAEGLAQVGSDAEFLGEMRSCAKAYSLVAGHVTTDDLRRVAEKTGLLPRSSHSWGCIFKEKG